MHKKKDFRLIKEAISQLPDEYKNIITLRDLNELSNSFSHLSSIESRK